MITLLIVSVMLALSAPIMSKRINNAATNEYSSNLLPSGMVSFFNKPCSDVAGKWSDIPASWQGRYPRIVGNYEICDIKGTCTDASIAYNDKYDDATRKLEGEIGGTYSTFGKSTGPFKKTDVMWSGKGLPSGGDSVYQQKFDSSYVLPTAEENRVKTVGLYMCVKD